VWHGEEWRRVIALEERGVDGLRENGPNCRVRTKPPEVAGRKNGQASTPKRKKDPRTIISKEKGAGLRKQ